jgi:hypothetical protein
VAANDGEDRAYAPAADEPGRFLKDVRDTLHFMIDQRLSFCVGGLGAVAGGYASDHGVGTYSGGVSVSAAWIAVALVVVETASAVVVNFATAGLSPWLWLVLAVVVVVTCVLTWWLHQSSAQSTRVGIRATAGGEVVDSPVEAPGKGDVRVSIKASRRGKVRRSGAKIRG